MGNVICIKTKQQISCDNPDQLPARAMTCPYCRDVVLLAPGETASFTCRQPEAHEPAAGFRQHVHTNGRTLQNDFVPFMLEQ